MYNDLSAGFQENKSKKQRTLLSLIIGCGTITVLTAALVTEIVASLVTARRISK